MVVHVLLSDFYKIIHFYEFSVRLQYTLVCCKRTLHYSVVHMCINVQRIQIYMCTTNVFRGRSPCATGRAILGAGEMVGSGGGGSGETSCCGGMSGPGGGGATPDTREGTVSPRPGLAGGVMGVCPGGMGATGGTRGVDTAARIEPGAMVGGPGAGTATCVGPSDTVGG